MSLYPELSTSSRPPGLSTSPALQKGIALVLVLAAITLVSMFVIALLSVSKNQERVSSSYANALDARIAASSAIQLVQSQIAAATTLGIDPDTGQGTHAWASQPGALRVFDNAGQLRGIYKLYSSGQMIEANANFLLSGNDNPENWKALPDEFVDINEPVFRDSWIYPIASPESLGVVVGFDSSRENSGEVPYDDRLAMPVRWIYLDEEGNSFTDPSAGNPVLRIAFWTDDESSKININTASATDTNSHADIPRANFRAEREIMGFTQPAQNEFNRYPGHPATVNMRTVFPNLSIRDIIEASSRYEWGGSENASKRIDNATRVSLTNSKTNRLYPTFEEYLYAPSRTVQLALSSDLLNQRRFFLTTTSRSSDLNLFGQPRVTIWPLFASGANDDPRTENQNRRTPYDQLIATASTLASAQPQGRLYAFVRNNPLSQTDDWTLFPRNRSLFSYLRSMTSSSRSIPGFSGNFEAKYSFAGERDQILTAIFDYIRCTNLNDTYKDQPVGFLPYTRKMTLPGTAHQDSAALAGAGYVLPILINDFNTRGAGRVPVLSEVGIWFIQTYANEVLDGSGNVVSASGPFDPPRVQAGLLLETFSPMQGPMPWLPLNFSISLNNLNPPRIKGMNIFANDQSESHSHGPVVSFRNGQAFGGIDGWSWTFSGHPTTSGNTSFPHSLARNPPWAMKKADSIELDAGASEFAMEGGEIVISLQCEPNNGAHLVPPTIPRVASGTPYQTYEIRVPSALTLPVPDPVAWETGTQSWQTELNRNGWTKRYHATEGMRFLQEDVVRGIELRDGDARIVAYCQNVPPGFFREHENYNTSNRLAHGFRTSGREKTAYRGTTNGGYLNVSYGGDPALANDMWQSHRPKITSRISNLLAEGWEGDFDTGLAQFPDGAYLNKSDEGGLNHNANTPPYFYYFWYQGAGLFSPLKQSPSAVVFGSLPTGVKQTIAAYEANNFSQGAPWRTLTFCPNPLAGSSHFGLSPPPDHLLLDLFTMPIVEPYAISEPFSTAGRLNMNYQIVPFIHIERKTAMHAALGTQQVIAIRDDYADNYKFPQNILSAAAAPNRQIRFPVNIPQTLLQFDRRFGIENDIFRSASEICSLFLIPDLPGVDASNITTWWENYQLTGNNLRERPYATLYPLLTTKSNVFTTHVRAQAIQRLPNGEFAVNGEYRGSVTFERFLDPNDPALESGEVNPDEKSLEPLFKFRTLLSKQFDL